MHLNPVDAVPQFLEPVLSVSFRCIAVPIPFAIDSYSSTFAFLRLSFGVFPVSMEVEATADYSNAVVETPEILSEEEVQRTMHFLLSLAVLFDTSDFEHKSGPGKIGWRDAPAFAKITSDLGICRRSVAEFPLRNANC